MNLQNSKTTSMKSTIPTSSFPVLDNRSGTILPANGKFTPSNKRRLYSEPGMIMASDEGRSHLAGSSQQWTKRIKFSTKNYSKLIINYSPSSKMNTLASSLLAAPLEASSTAGITANAMANNNVSIDSKLRETTTNGNVANNQTRDTQQSGRQTENRYTSTAKNNVQITISKPVITKVTEPLNSGTATSLTKSLESSISTVQMTSYSSTSAKSISTSFSGHFENETNAASYRLKISTLPTRSVKKLNSQDKTPTASSSRQWKNSNVKTYSDQATFASNLRQSDSGQMHFTTTIIQGRHTRNLFESLIAKNIATFSETLTTDKPGRSFSAYNGTQYKPVYTTKIQNISTTNAFQQLSRETPPMPDTGGSQNWASQQTKPRATRITESRPIVGLTTTPSNHAFAFDPFTAASVVTTKDTSLSILNQAKPLHIQTLFSRKNIEATTANNPSAQSITKVGASTVQTFVGGASTFQTSEMHNSQTSTRLSTILAHESRISFPVQTVTTLASEQKTSVATKETVKQTMSGNQEMDGKSVSISSVSSRPSRKITGLDGLINEVSITSTSTKTSNNSRGRMNNSLEMRSTIPYTTMRVSQNTSERQLLSDSDLPHITASTDTLSSLTPKMQTLTNKPMGIITKTITEKNTSWSEQLILESTASSSSVGTPNGQNRIASVVRFANGDRTTMHEKSMATSTKATVSTLVDNKSTLKTGSDHLTNKVIGPNAGSTKMTTVGSFLQSISVLMNRSTIAGGYYGQTNTVLNNETFPTSAAISETTTQTEGPRQGSYHAATISVAQQPSTTSLQKPIDQLLTSSPTNSSTSPLSRNKQPPSSHFVSASTIKILKLTTSSNEQQFSSRYMASSTSHESGIVLTDARKEGQRTSIKQLVGLLYTATPSTRHEINTPTISVKPPYSLHSTLTASMTSAPQPISNKLSPNLRKSENQSTAAYFTAASLKYTTGRQEQASTDIFNTSTKKQAISFLQSIGQYMNVSTTVKEGDDGRSLTSQQLSSRIDSISVTDAFLDTTVTKQNITISTKALSTKVVQNSNAKDQSGDENTTAIMNHEPIISSASQKQSSTEHSTFIDSQYINITNVTLSFKVGTSSGTNNMHNHLSTQRMTNSSSKILLNGTRGSTQSYNGTYTVFPQDKKVTATATNSQYQTKDFSKTATELKSSSKIGTAAPAHENVTLAAESSSIGKMDSSSQTMKRSTRSIFDEQQVNNKVKTFSVNGSVAPTTARIQLSHHMPSPSTTKIGSIRPPSNTQKSESSSVPTSIQNRKANTTIQRSSENAVTSTEIPQKTTTVSLHIMKKETNTAATSYGVPNLSSNYRTRMNVFTASVGGIKNDVQNLSSKPVKMTTLEILTQSSQQSRSQQVAMLSTGVTATDKVISSKRATYRPVILSSLENAFTTSTNLYKQSDTKHSGYDATSSMLGNIFRSRYQSTTAILTAEVNHTAAILETKSTQKYATDIPTDAQGRRINSTQIESASSTESNSKQKVTSSSGAIWKKSTSITEPQENVTVQEPSKTERAPTSSLVLFSSSTMKNRDLTKGKIVSSRTISDGKNEPAISLQPSSNKISTVSTVGHSRNAATSTTQAVINSTSIYSKNNTSTNYTQHLTRLQATTLSAKTISLQQLIGQRVADFIVIDTSKTVKPGTEILGTTYLFSGVTKIIMKSRASTQRNFESNVVTSNRSRSATTGVLGIENRTVSTAALENTLNSLMNVDPLISHTTEASSIRQQSKNQETSVVAGKTTNVGRKSREAQTMIKTVPSSDSTVVADTSVSLHNISRNSSTTKMENTSSISTRMTKSIFEPSVSDSASVVLEKSTKRFSNQFTPLSTTRIENNSNRMINSIGGAGATEIGMRTSTGSNLWSKSEHTSNPATIWSIKSTAIDAQESNSIHITTTSNKDQSNITTTQEVSKLQSCSQQFWTTATPTTAINGSASTPLQESSGGITETSTIGETRIGMMDDKLQNITIVLSSYASDISTTDFQVWSTSAATVPITVSANENSTGMNSHRQHMNGNDTFLLLTSRPATYFNDHYFQLDDDEVKNMNKSNETLR
uniref:Uncharacterized protein n=1 Tax=Romanomermis culicivorax TaxID=13658 RepID=A0A915KK82_ROMCU